VADWTFDDITARAADVAVKGQFDSNLKTQDLLNSIKASMAGSTSVLLFRDGASVVPIPLTGVPTIAGNTLTWPARNVTVNFIASHDIDSGTWTGRIQTATGRVAYAASVGKTTGVIRVSGDISSGSSTVTLGPITMTAPDLGTGSGGGTGGGTFTAGSPPGSGWTEILASGGTPVVVPANFVGWHRYFNLSPQVSPYPYKTHRGHDQRGVNDDVLTFMARMRPDANTWNRQPLDEFIAQTPGKTRVLPLFGTPTYARKYSDTAFSSVKYPSFSDAACAPVADYVASIVDRIYGAWGYSAADFPFLEVWNEPSFGYSGGGQYLDPVAGQRWTSTNNPLRLNPMFFNGDHTDLARIAQEIYENKISGVTVMGCGFELGLESDGLTTRMFNPRLFHEAGGMAYIDWFSYHSYIYEYDPSVVTKVRNNIRTWLDANGYSSMPMANSETGFEQPGPAYSKPDSEIASYAIRMFVRSAVAGDKMFIAYQDRGNQDIYNNPQGPTFKNPTGSATIQAALTSLDALNGRTIRQAQFNADGRVWIRFSDNTEILG